MSSAPRLLPVVAALILAFSSSATPGKESPTEPRIVGAARSEEDGTVLISTSDLGTFRAYQSRAAPGPLYTGTCYYIDSVSVINPGAGCDTVPKNYTSFGRWIFYICTDPPNCTNVVPNCNVRLTVRAIQGDGFHFHGDPNRPMGAPIDTSGTTGFDGLQFRIPFRWPQVAGPLEIRFFATSSCGPTDSSAVDWVYCLEAAPLVPSAPCPPCTGTPFNIPAVEFPLLPIGPDYDLTGMTPIHPLNHYGLRGMVDSLVSAARAFRTKFPTGTKMGFNDMSLAYGGCSTPTRLAIGRHLLIAAIASAWNVTSALTGSDPIPRSHRATNTSDTQRSPSGLETSRFTRSSTRTTGI